MAIDIDELERLAGEERAELESLTAHRQKYGLTEPSDAWKEFLAASGNEGVVGDDAYLLKVRPAAVLELVAELRRSWRQSHENMLAMDAANERAQTAELEVMHLAQETLDMWWQIHNSGGHTKRCQPGCTGANRYADLAYGVPPKKKP